MPLLYLGYSICTSHDEFRVFRLVFFVESIFWSLLAYFCLKSQWLMLATNGLLVVSTLEWSQTTVMLSVPLAIVLVAVDANHDYEVSAILSPCSLCMNAAGNFTVQVSLVNYALSQTNGHLLLGN